MDDDSRDCVAVVDHSWHIESHCSFDDSVVVVDKAASDATMDDDDRWREYSRIVADRMRLHCSCSSMIRLLDRQRMATS